MARYENMYTSKLNSFNFHFLILDGTEIQMSTLIECDQIVDRKRYRAWLNYEQKWVLQWYTSEFKRY